MKHRSSCVIVGLVLATAATFSDALAQTLPNTPANRARGVVGCTQTRSGIVCPGAPSGGGGSYGYGGGTSAFNMGMSLGNAMWQAFEAMERQARQQRMTMARNLNDQGVALYNSGDYQGALAAFRNGLQYSPGSPTLLGNIQETEKRLTEQRAEADRRTRAQLAQARERISAMLGGLADDVARNNAELTAAGDLSFVAPAGTSFFGLGGGPGGAAPPSGEGLAFVGPGESLFSRGTKYSAPVDLREGASDQLASSLPAGAGGGARPVEGEGGLKFVGPEESLKAAVETPPKTAPRPPAARESVSEAKVAARAGSGKAAPPVPMTEEERRARTEAGWKPPGGGPTRETVRVGKELLDRIVGGQIRVEDMTPEQRLWLADFVQSMRKEASVRKALKPDGTELTDQEIAKNLAEQANAARTSAIEWLKNDGTDFWTRAAGPGQVLLGTVQAGAGIAQFFPGTAPAGAMFSAGQSVGSLGREGYLWWQSLKEGNDKFKNLGNVVLAAPGGTDGAWTMAENAWLGSPPVPSAARTTLGVVSDAFSLPGKIQNTAERVEHNDKTGAALGVLDIGATAGKVGVGGLLTADVIGSAPAREIVKKTLTIHAPGVATSLNNPGLPVALARLGGASDVFSGVNTARDGMQAWRDARENRDMARQGITHLLEGAGRLETQSAYFSERDKIKTMLRDPKNRHVIELLEEYASPPPSGR